MTNPLMESAEAFLGQIEDALGARAASVVRLTSSPSDRSSVLKSLRLMEWRPESRWPLVVVERAPEVALVRDRLMSDYAALAEGLGEEGMRVDPLTAPAPADDADALDGARPLYGDSELERALETAQLGRLWQRAAQQVVGGAGEYIDGLMLVLLPPSSLGSGPMDGRHYQQLVSHLKLVADKDDRLRLLAYDPAGMLERVAPEHARFAVDDGALSAYVEKAAADAAVAERPIDGVKGAGSRLSPAERKEVEDALGRKLPSDDVAATLRAAMFEAGRLLADGHFESAAQRLRAARMLCQLSGLPAEEAVLLIATGSAFLSAREPERALHAFELARRVAGQSALDVDLEIHALLGTGGVHLMAKHWTQADAAYAQALEAVTASAKDTDATPAALTIELWRLRAHCAAEMGELSIAAAHATEALAIADGLAGEEVVEQTTAPLLVEQLAPRLQAAGHTSHAEALRRRLAELQDSPTLAPPPPSEPQPSGGQPGSGGIRP